jgi:hypothetical protein
MADLTQHVSALAAKAVQRAGLILRRPGKTLPLILRAHPLIPNCGRSAGEPGTLLSVKFFPAVSSGRFVPGIFAAGVAKAPARVLVSPERT